AHVRSALPRTRCLPHRSTTLAGRTWSTWPISACIGPNAMAATAGSGLSRRMRPWPPTQGKSRWIWTCWSPKATCPSCRSMTWPPQADSTARPPPGAFGDVRSRRGIFHKLSGRRLAAGLLALACGLRTGGILVVLAHLGDHLPVALAQAALVRALLPRLHREALRVRVVGIAQRKLGMLLQLLGPARRGCGSHRRHARGARLAALAQRRQRL